MTTLTKQDLTNTFVMEMGFSAAKAAATTELMVATIKNSIFNKYTIYIPRYMKIISTVKAPRPGRNPKTMVPAVITQRHHVRHSNTARPVMDGKLTKSALIDTVAESGFTLREATKITNLFYKFIKRTSKGECRIEFRGLGNFASVWKGPRNGRNPKTGASVTTKGRYIPYFKCSTALRKAMDRQYL